MPQMDQQALAEIQALEARKDYSNPRYEELLMQYFYVDHILRMPADAWPEPVLRSLGHLNHDIYVLLQGPSELGSSGLLDQWNRTADLPRITVPTLVVGARYDTMDPRHMRGYVARFNRRLIGLTGSPGAIAAARKAFDVTAKQGHPDENGNYAFDHSLFIYFAGPDGKVLRTFHASQPAASIASDVRKLLPAVGPASGGGP